MNVAIVDTETTKNGYVYDLGVAIMNAATGEVIATMNAIVEETFNDVSEMATSYYAAKIPAYLEAINLGSLKSSPLVSASSVLVRFLKRMMCAPFGRTIWRSTLRL